MPDDFLFDVFLSYSAKDKAIVRDIATRLTKNGVRVWFDEQQIKPSDHISVKTEEGMENSRVLVFCMSANISEEELKRSEFASLQFRDPLSSDRQVIIVELDKSHKKLGSSLQSNSIQWDSNTFGTLVRRIKTDGRASVEETRETTDEWETISIGQASEVNDVAIRHSYNQVITGAQDGTVRVWDISTGQCLMILEHQRVCIRCLRINRREQLLAVGTTSGRVYLWNLETFKLIREFVVPIRSWITDVWFLDADKMIVAHVAKDQLWLIQTENGIVTQSKDENLLACIPRIVPDFETIRDVLFQSLKFRLNITGGKQVLFEPIGHFKAVWSVSFSRDGRTALSASLDGTMRLWDINSPTCINTFQTELRREFVVLGADSETTVVGSLDQEARVVNMKTGAVLSKFRGHRKHCGAYCGAVSPNISFAATGSDRGEILMWDIKSRRVLHSFVGHEDAITAILIDEKGESIISGGEDRTIRLWSVSGRNCTHTFKGHTKQITSLAVDSDCRRIVSGSVDQTLRVWDTSTGKCLFALEGHKSGVWSVAISTDGKWALSGSGSQQLLNDYAVRVWNLDSGLCIRELVGHTDVVVGVQILKDGRIVSCGANGVIHIWNYRIPSSHHEFLRENDNQARYLNAKVLVVGDTHAGKTGLTHRLATGKWKSIEESTVGAWSTQWAIQDTMAKDGEEREIWLWDFGGQADQRLIHQLYLDGSALIIQLFDADQENVLPGLREWQTALRRCVKEPIPQFLVAGRIDAGFKASKAKIKAYAGEQMMKFFETSAREGTGCEELKKSLIESIPWEQMTRRASPRIFKLIKDQILKLRDEGQVLHTFKELRELLWRRLPDESRFTDDILRTVIGLLDGPGVVKELDYGTYILLAPEWINSYAQAVLRTLRSDEKELGTLPLRSIAEGKLLYHYQGRDGEEVKMRRLQPEANERVVLGEMEKQLEERGLCLRQGDKLVFPSHCGRDRPQMQKNPVVFVSYAVKGYLDDIYATLVVKLADCGAFTLKELWRDAADFVTLEGDHHMGLKLNRLSGCNGEISIYFGKGVTRQEQVIFANYIDTHLRSSSEEEPRRLRHYVCPHCHTAKGNPEALMQKLMAKKEEAEVVCDVCDKSFPLWDSMEKKFASQSVCDAVLGMQKDDDIRLTSRRQGKLLVLEVGARITSANQKWFEIPTEEDDGIDIQMEFTDEAGNGVGQGLCLQLKAGNSFLTKRKTDGVEVFKIKKQRWVKTWMNQPFPVMLVIGTLPEDRDFDRRGDKRQFESIRWMEINSVLKRLSENGTKPVKQIEFKGEEVNMTTVMQWRKRVMSRE